MLETHQTGNREVSCLSTVWLHQHKPNYPAFKGQARSDTAQFACASASRVKWPVYLLLDQSDFAFASP